MPPNLDRRVDALERLGKAPQALANLSDVELMRRILRLHFERDPTTDELHEWMTQPTPEAERQSREMLNAVRRRLQSFASQSEAGHAQT